MTSTGQALRARITNGPTAWFGGAQDALSALLVDQSELDGIFSTGFGISAALLGQPDMELYTLSENVATVNRMANVVKKPIFVDADTGYGGVLNVARTVREFEKAGAAALQLEDQISPKRCPAATTSSTLVSLDDALARIKAALDARTDPDLLIVARTDAVDPSEALDRAARYAEAGADLIQPISRTFDRYEQLVQLRETCGRRLSLQLMAGTWMTALTREQIESVAAFASYPIASLLTTVHTVQANLAELARRRSGDFANLPFEQTTMAAFKKLIGWHELEARQAHYETGGAH
ncbi:oxaloacetate decarboxylase [Xenophilus sp. Marseille-Q4582]|uniref:isocitrate lyase/PEP mutase family protein n=1 Tax=Xenophilus sp. Marseille-Q4582 TaxID=2866600 RepID=UPI001CE4830D|nr:isocitrate lyase/PEP mutase family protein [Xenophilus sp. Marseille-Q4582]